MKKLVLPFLILLSTFSDPAQASRRSASVPEVQAAIMSAGAEQSETAIAQARRLCETAGGYFDPTRVDIRVESETRSRYDRRNSGDPRRRALGYIFGAPRPTDYSNEVRVEVSVDNACLREMPRARN